MGGESAEEPTVHTMRLSTDAAGVIEEQWSRLYDLSGEESADNWCAGIRSAITSLATYPERCTVAAENRLFSGGTLRQHLYQKRRGGPAWRILFTIHEADDNDPATVRVHDIRHSAQAPMTEWPAKDEK